MINKKQQRSGGKYLHLSICDRILFKTQNHKISL